MLNFRKLKKDYSQTILKEGKALYDKQTIESAKIVKLDPQSVRLSCQVMGSFDNTYQCEIEIDRRESTTIDSDCDCPYKYDCQHLAATLFYLEEHFDGILVSYSKENDMDKKNDIDAEEKESLRETIKEAENKEILRKGKKQQRELLEEYVGASDVLGTSPFFHSDDERVLENVELALMVALPAPSPIKRDMSFSLEVQLALRLPFRSKPLHILNVKEFLDAVRFREPMYIGSKRYYFDLTSFDRSSSVILKLILDNVRYADAKEERNLRLGLLDDEAFSFVLNQAYEFTVQQGSKRGQSEDHFMQPLPCLYGTSLEEPLCYAPNSCTLDIALEYLEAPAPKILLKPTVFINNDEQIDLSEAIILACSKPGIIHQNVYYKFPEYIRRSHLRNLETLLSVTIPEPLFGTFVENSIPELMKYAQISNHDIIERFVTLPFVGKLEAECEIRYLNGELDALLTFLYDDIRIPAVSSQLTIPNLMAFVTPEGILARNLTEEQHIISDLFQDFLFDPAESAFVTKSEKKIVEFMTEVIPRNQNTVHFNCPENLLEQFVYDDTTFKLELRETSRIDQYEVNLTVDGHLKGIPLSSLWECLSMRRAFIELVRKKAVRKKGSPLESQSKPHKILVLDLERLAPIVAIFDELGITELSNSIEQRPLWSLANINPEQFEGLPIEFSMSERLIEIQEQMLGIRPMVTSAIPKAIDATLRSYQVEGVSWLERLRQMRLSGILADDMGLGKTLQAITAITQYKLDNPKTISLVVCPTSLVYNWKEEFYKFNPKLKVLPVDGTPAQRKKLLNGIEKFDVVITSYSLLQKDIDFYKEQQFSYTVLDEAQHIKNRGTRNAKSVKMVQAAHRLILTGTPIENSLDELWSLFDFLMPGLLSSYDRFIERYVRIPSQTGVRDLETLRRKVNPFILRRMKKDVLEELPPVSEITYRCHLSDVQRELYTSYAKSARDELFQLVNKEGFDRVQIHVLATLTRLKQICCHPAIFAKEKVESGDSAKYEMLLELLQTLIEGGHRTVIFSQYTRMLNIMRDDFIQQGIRFEYLDGSSKNRMDIVRRFNEDDTIPVFLVSLKAGGTGLNLTGADTVIHYDIWWNPALENQATDRVHRIGQKRSVSSCKLVTLDTIEEKIVDLQNRKKGLVQQVLNCDEEVISKLTWEEVLELLQT
jgi:SNF2 family DNA or RNA helicase